MSPVFQRRAVAELLASVDALPPPERVEERVLAEACGHILARDLIAGADLPPRSMVVEDGYALRADSTLGAGDYSPLELRLLGPGREVDAGSAQAVVRGEPLPAGADAVLRLDAADVVGDGLEVAASLAPGTGVVTAGEEYRRGDTLLAAGRCLRPQDLALLSLAGWQRLPVRVQPRVDVFLAGRFEQDANGPMLDALIRRDGGRVETLSRSTSQSGLVALLRNSRADLILVVGASGQSPADHGVAALASVGEVGAHGVAMHPGDTLALGRVGDRPVMVLPGAPLACLFAYDLFAARLLRRWAGRSADLPYPVRSVRLRGKVASSIGRLEFCRVRLVDGEAQPIAIAEDRLLHTVVRADGFFMVPEQSEGYPAGTEVRLYLYDAGPQAERGDER